MAKLLGDLEQKVMNIIWENKEAMKPAEVKDEINEDLAYTTVMTVMKRLSEKGILKRQKCGNYYCYYACEPKGSFVKEKISKVYENIVSCYGDLAISQFVDTVKSNPDDLKALREYLEGTE